MGRLATNELEDIFRHRKAQPPTNSVAHRMDVSRGWQVGLSIQQCNAYMLERRLATDVTFLLDTEHTKVEVTAHKYVLVSRSPVFEAMLCGEFQETSSNIVITDIDVDSFNQLLKYIYYDDATVTSDNVLHILFAAKKYMIEGLSEKCLDFIKCNISEETVCMFLNHCLMYVEESLVQHCLKFIGPRVSTIFHSEQFLDLSKAALLQVVRYDRLVIDSEIDVLKACKRWAVHSVCNDDVDDTSEDCPEHTVPDSEIRNILGECLFNIRFATMTVDELAKAVGSSKLLTDEETRVLFCHLSTWQYADELNRMGFNTMPRLTTYDCCRRFWQVGSGWTYDRTLPDAISFQVDRPIWIMGISVYGGETLGSVHDYVLEVHNGTDNDWAVHCKGILETDGTDNPIPVLFDVPHRLEPGTAHTVRLLMLGPKTYFGERGVRTIRQSGVKFSFSSSSESLNDTVVAGGQIPELIFRRV